MNYIKIIKQTSGPQFRPAFPAINAMAQYAWEVQRSGTCPVHYNVYRLWWNQRGVEWISTGLFICYLRFTAAATVQLQVVRWLPNDRLKESWRWPISTQCPEISLVGLRKTTKYLGLTSRCPGRYSQLPEASAPQPTCSDLKTCQQWLIHYMNIVSDNVHCVSHLRYVTFRILDRSPSSGERRKWPYSAGSVGPSSNQDHIFLTGYTKYDPGDNRKF
jgi:hypothetical protein